MQAQIQSEAIPREKADYFRVPGAHLYTVSHRVPDPLARVLLIGPFASERHFSYHPWVRWARYLATRRFEVLRYDYRGVGESTGVFEEMSFKTWSEDVELLVDSLSSGLPLVLHGLELGAILAARAFSLGAGDALLLWSPPQDANQALRAILRRWAGLEQLFESVENRKSASEYIRLLEQGTSIEVQGYRWTSHLWRESFHFDLPPTDEAAAQQHRRPVKLVRFGRNQASGITPYLHRDEIKDIDWLYSSSFDWVSQVLAPSAGEVHERVN